MVLAIDFHALVLQLFIEKKVEFQGPIVQNVAYINRSQTLNITYTAVSNIDSRGSNGLEIWISRFFFL
jgi:hypothetical protein